MNIQTFNFLDFLSRYNNDPEETLSFFEVMESIPDIKPHNAWVAGGAIRRTLIGQALDSDIDVFFRDNASLVTYRAHLVGEGFKRISDNKHQETYKNDDGLLVQLIKIGYYQNVDDLLNSFDFTITQFAYDGEKLYCGEHSLWDLSRRRLAVHKITYGVASMRRLVKYTKQGFTACAGCMAQFLTEVANDPRIINSEVEYID